MHPFKPKKSTLPAATSQYQDTRKGKFIRDPVVDSVDLTATKYHQVEDAFVKRNAAVLHVRNYYEAFEMLVLQD